MAIAALAAVAVAGVCWVVLTSLSALVSAVPSPDEQWRDPPPRYWRMLGFIGHATGHWFGGWVPRGTRLRLIDLLRRAGLEYSLTVDLFVAGQVCGAVLAVAVAWFVARPWGGLGVLAAIAVALLGALLPISWLRDRIERRSRQIVRSLPFYLDVITLAIEAGANLTGALQHAADRGPRGPMGDELMRVLRDVRAGRTRAEALRQLAERLRMPAISNWIAAVLTAERQGSSLGPILRAQADQRRNERFLRAEELAMKAPVKMLFPLMTCIFPCTFVIVFFPVAIRLLEEGILR